MSSKTNGMLSRYRNLIDSTFGTSRGLVRAFLAELEYLLGTVNTFTTLNPGSVSRLVFVCLGNINRSAFADAVARKACANTTSIGLSTSSGAPAFHKAITTASRFDISLEQHRATNFSDYTYQDGDLLLAMEIRHARELLKRGIPAGRIALLGHWGSPRRIHLHDPHVLSDRYFEVCFTLLNSAVIRLVSELRAGNSPCVDQ